MVILNVLGKHCLNSLESCKEIVYKMTEENRADTRFAFHLEKTAEKVVETRLDKRATNERTCRT